MKVIFLCSNYEPGGAQRTAIRLCEEFNKKGIDSQCWFMHRRSVNFSNKKPIIILNKKISCLIEVWKISKTLNKKFRKEKPDAVISFLPYANILGQLISLISGVKNRISSHRNISTEELSLGQKVLDYLWAELGIYTSITAVSNSTKASFNYYSKPVFNKIKVINNGVSECTSALSKNECREKFGLDKDAFIIGNIGRLVEQKNQMLLINILPHLKETVLVIVGKGELLTELECRALELNVRNRVLIIPDLNFNFIPDFLKAIDVFVMPSYFEGMSNALIEALYAGLPVVSSDVESQIDVLVRECDNFKAAILVSNDKPAEWVKSISAIRDNDQIRVRLSENALMRSKDFSVESMTEKFLTML